MPKPTSLILSLSSLLVAVKSFACSSCIGGGPISPDSGPAHSHGEVFGVTLKHDYFAGDTIYSGTDRIGNANGQYLRQNNTTVGITYDLNESWSAFLGIRHSVKRYRREEDVGGVDTWVNRSESGLTDPVLGVQYSSPLMVREGERLELGVFGGVTLPVGDTRLIKEEVGELSSGGHAHGAVHDHDLAMGSGEFGAVGALTLDYALERFRARTSVNYTWRPEGDYGYDFADNYGWDVAAGAELTAGGHAKAGSVLMIGLTGEHAGHDKIDGKVVELTANDVVYAGPRLRVEYDSSWQAMLQLDMPVYAYSARETIVSSWRARAGFTHRF